MHIAYSASDPDKARVLDGLEASVHWLFLGVSVVMLLIALGSLSISLALLVIGIRLFQSGRRDLSKPNDPQQSMSELRNNVQKVLKGEIDIENTAVGQVGDVERF